MTPSPFPAARATEAPSSVITVIGTIRLTQRRQCGLLLQLYSMRQIDELSLSVFVQVLQISTSIYIFPREWITREFKVVLSPALQAETFPTR